MIVYCLFGVEILFYFVKVCLFLCYKGVDFEWIGCSKEMEEEFVVLVKVLIVLLFLFLNCLVNQDLISIFVIVEVDYVDLLVVFDDLVCVVLVLLLEDYVDEWFNKLMFFN